MALERRYQMGAKRADTALPGLIQKADDTVWIVNSDGSEERVSGGGISQVFNARDYGTLGTQDAVRSALEAHRAAGQGRVYIPAGTWTLDTGDAQEGALALYWDNIEIFGDGPATILQSTLNGQGVFHPHGAWKASLSNQTVGWYPYRSSFPISAATRNQQQVTCVTGADAGNFTVGDYVYVSTGHVTTVTSSIQPDAELNQVVAVNIGTGVIRLRWPLLKAYAQEYFASGVGSVTTTTAPAVAGATSVPVTSAAGFSIGDIVSFTGSGGTSHRAILTGVSGSTLTFADHPVSAGATIANGATVTNAVGLTTTSVTAKPAVFGIAKVTDVTMQNLHIHDLALDNTSVTNFATNLPGGNICGMRVERVKNIGKGGLLSQGNMRRVWVERNDIHILTGGGGYAISYGSAAGDMFIRGNRISNDDYNQGVVLSEGNGAVAIDHNIISGADTGAANDIPIAIQTRSQGIVVAGNVIQNCGSSGMIVVDDFCPGGGVIHGNTLTGISGDRAVAIGSTGWKEYGNHVDPVLIGLAQYGGGGQQALEIKTLSAWVRFDRTTAVLGTLLGRCVVSAVRIFVSQGFDGTTPKVSCGFDGTTTAYAGATDVSAFGVVTPAAGAGYLGYFDTVNTRTVKAYYTGGASAAGKALVTVEYYPVPEDE